MIRKLARLTLILSFCLIIHNQIWRNLDFNQQIGTIIKVSIILAFFEIILKPIIKLLLLPINILTLGAIRLVINTLGLYLASFILGNFSLQDISTTGSTWQGFNVPPFHFTNFFAYLVSSLTINLLLSLAAIILYRKRRI